MTLPPAPMDLQIVQSRPLLEMRLSKIWHALKYRTSKIESTFPPDRAEIGPAHKLGTFKSCKVFEGSLQEIAIAFDAEVRKIRSLSLNLARSKEMVAFVPRSLACSNIAAFLNTTRPNLVSPVKVAIAKRGGAGEEGVIERGGSGEGAREPDVAGEGGICEQGGAGEGGV